MAGLSKPGDKVGLPLRSAGVAPAAAHGFDYEISHLKYLLTTNSGVPETPQWLIWTV